jgi:hypothetical protein
MPTDSFEKNNLGWQLSQLQQKIGEWWELQTSRFAPNVPNLSLPSWWDSPILQKLVKTAFWVILGLLLIWVGWQMWQRFHPYIYSLTNPLKQTADKGSRTPAQELSVATWLQRSQKLQQQGNYREACRCLYMAMLQRLNDSGLAPHHSSRTDGEYLQLVQQLSQPQPYQTLIMTHQRLCFSNAEVSSAVFEQCQQAYREIEAL